LVVSFIRLNGIIPKIRLKRLTLTEAKVDQRKQLRRMPKAKKALEIK